MTQRRQEEGTPFVTIRGEGEPRPTRYRVERFLEEGQVTALYGRGGSGKSYVAAILAVLVSEGLPFGRLDTDSTSVLTLDYETSAEEWENRIRRVARGLDMRELPAIHYRPMALAIADDIWTVKRMVDREKIGLVIIDSLGLACGGEPESAEVVLRMFAALRSLETTVLAIDHISAAQTEKRDRRRPFGSIYKENVPRSLWELRAHQESGASEIAISLYHRKSNNASLEKPLFFNLTFGRDWTRLTPTDARDVPQLTEGLSLRDRLWYALTQPKDVMALVTELDVPENSVRGTLNRHRDRFVKVGTLWARMAEQHSNGTP